MNNEFTKLTLYYVTAPMYVGDFLQIGQNKRYEGGTVAK